MIVINSNQRKPILITSTLLLFFLCLFFWLIRTPTKQLQYASATTLIDHPNLRDPNLPPAWHNTTRVKAAFVILTRNNELEALRYTMQQLEARFNHKFNYPYVFLNDVEFTQEFKDLTLSLTNAKTNYGRSFWEPLWVLHIN